MWSKTSRHLLLLSCVFAGLICNPAIGRCDPPLPVGARGTQIIDLGSALKLAGVDNPNILLARQRVVEATAQRQFAAAQFLPTLNAGSNVDVHTGPVQRDTGVILEVNRNALYVGAGANAVAAGTVTIPGVGYNLNVSQTIYNYLSSRQQVARRRYAEAAVGNEMLRRVASVYLDLLRAEGVRSVTLQARNEAQGIAQITATYARVKQGRQADADRAAVEADDRRIDHIEAEANVLIASARLAELLSIDPAVRLRPAEERLVPLPVVPDPVPLSELLAIALMQRPELAERRTAVRQALLELSAARVLPFSPNVIVGQSGGVFGGGSNLATTPPGSLDNRDDLDVIIYWTVQNMGLGNLDLIRIAASRTRGARLEQLDMLNRVRSEVAQAYERKLTYYDKLVFAEEAVPIGVRAFTKDFERIRQQVGLPIELLESFRLLNLARFDLLDAIADYNQAQIDLYVALGQPPIDMLARPVPTAGIGPTSVLKK